MGHFDLGIRMALVMYGQAKYRDLNAVLADDFAVHVLAHEQRMERLDSLTPDLLFTAFDGVAESRGFRVGPEERPPRPERR